MDFLSPLPDILSYSFGTWFLFLNVSGWCLHPLSYLRSKKLCCLLPHPSPYINNHFHCLHSSSFRVSLDLLLPSIHSFTPAWVQTSASLPWTMHPEVTSPYTVPSPAPTKPWFYAAKCTTKVISSSYFRSSVYRVKFKHLRWEYTVFLHQVITLSSPLLDPLLWNRWWTFMPPWNFLWLSFFPSLSY